MGVQKEPVQRYNDNTYKEWKWAGPLWESQHHHPGLFEWTYHSTAWGTDNEEREIGRKYPKVKDPLQKDAETLESDFPPLFFYFKFIPLEKVSLLLSLTNTASSQSIKHHCNCASRQKKIFLLSQCTGIRWYNKKTFGIWLLAFFTLLRQLFSRKVTRSVNHREQRYNRWLCILFVHRCVSNRDEWTWKYSRHSISPGRFSGGAEIQVWEQLLRMKIWNRITLVWLEIFQSYQTNR